VLGDEPVAPVRTVPVTGSRASVPREEKVIAMKRTTVGDVMTTRVVAVHKDASFKEMIVKMREFRISAFPVVDHEGRVIGVVSEADMLNKEADLAADVGPLASILRFRDHEKSAAVTAGELMTSPPVVIGPDAPVTEASRRMRDRRVKRLPVINSSRHLIGIVCRADVLSVFGRPGCGDPPRVDRRGDRGMLPDGLEAVRRHRAQRCRDAYRAPRERPGRSRAGRTGTAHRRRRRGPGPAELCGQGLMTH